MTDFFRTLAEDMKDEDTTILSDGKSSAEFTEYIDTGSYAMNAVLGGSIYSGIPNTKVVGLVGESSTGKTYIALGILKNFLEMNPTSGAVYFDTEAAVTKQMMTERGIDPNRVIISEPNTIEDFQHKATVLCDSYMSRPKKERPPMMFILDSLGMLSSRKELEGAETGNQKADMGRAQKLLKGTFRTLTSKLAKARIPMIVTGHVYADIGSMYPSNKVAGGCLVAGTRVFTNTGYTNIEDFKGGELVMTKEGEWKEVLETHHFEDKETLEIEFENGFKVTCTKNHKFFINEEWVRAEDIVEGDDCAVITGDNGTQILKVNSAKPVGVNEVFDISVADHENYILEHGVVSHNSGMKYAASIIAMLGKSQDKDAKTRILNGVFIRMKMHKSRFTREGSEIKGYVNFINGLDRYYGLLPMALEAGIWEKSGNKVVVCDGTKRFEKFINNNPEQFYSEDVLKRIDEFAKSRFSYGTKSIDEDEIANEEDDA